MYELDPPFTQSCTESKKGLRSAVDNPKASCSRGAVDEGRVVGGAVVVDDAADDDGADMVAVFDDVEGVACSLCPFAGDDTVAGRIREGLLDDGFCSSTSSFLDSESTFASSVNTIKRSCVF